MSAVHLVLRHTLEWRLGGTLCTIALGSSNVVLSWSRPSGYFWLALTVLVTGCAVVLSYVEHRSIARQHVPADATSDAPRTYDQLSPVAHTLALLAAAGDQQEVARLRGQGIQTVVAAAAALIEVPRARACWFALDGDVIRPGNVYAGRSERPHTWFRRGTPAGDAVFDLVESGGHLWCPDTLAAPPVGWDASVAREYRTFIAVSVSAEGRPLGMLTVDAPAPGDLDPLDLPALRTLASFLAAAVCPRSELPAASTLTRSFRVQPFGTDRVGS